MLLSKKPVRGFTLVELAIVLAVAGLLFVGLWRLLSGANQQTRDSSAAGEQSQLIGAVTGFLSSTYGQEWMASQCTVGTGCPIGTTFQIPLPLSAATAAGLAACYGAGDTALSAAPANMLNPAPGINTPGGAWCSALPPGFYSGTTNSYGQTYTIWVMYNSQTTANTKPPATYSFMIVTTGGDVIPDTSGGRISGLIGSDGGFLYSTAICGVPNWKNACGTYGAWSQDITAYGAPGAPASGGFIASRTYISPNQNSNLPWLARILMANDTSNPPYYNTMQTPLYLGTTIVGGVPVPNTFYLGDSNTLTTGGGTINMQAGQIMDTSGNGDEIDMDTTGGAALTSGAYINLKTHCTSYPGGTSGTVSLSYVAGCVAGLQLNGDGNVAGLFNVYALYANTFIYQTSDARLKTDIKPLADPLDSVMRMKPVTFSFKANHEKGVGVIAQDIEKIYPQLVLERPDGMKSVNYEGLIAPLIGAVQELKQENDTLRTRLHDEEQRERALEKKLQQ